jgi:acyl-coenzyme A thioesterase PaaI-like protein
MAARVPKTTKDLISAGWRKVEDDGFIGHIGPLWMLVDQNEASFGFFARKIHKNRAGVVQGGMLATIADRAMGMTARLLEPTRQQMTIQLDLQYFEVARLGTFVSATGKLWKQTSTLAFLSARLESDGRLVATASGLWRIRPGTSLGRRRSTRKRSLRPSE